MGRSRCTPARCIARWPACWKATSSKSWTVSPDPSSDDERRRYYRLTTRGIAVARAEVGRLEGQLAAARTRRLLKGVRA